MNAFLHALGEVLLGKVTYPGFAFGILLIACLYLWTAGMQLLSYVKALRAPHDSTFTLATAPRHMLKDLSVVCIALACTCVLFSVDADLRADALNELVYLGELLGAPASPEKIAEVTAFRQVSELCGFATTTLLISAAGLSVLQLVALRYPRPESPAA